MHLPGGPGNAPCDCALPVTREQAGRLHAYASQHPERVVIMSELQGRWIGALLDFLPPARPARTASSRG
jgi:hypothetical protein